MSNDPIWQARSANRRGQTARLVAFSLSGGVAAALVFVSALPAAAASMSWQIVATIPTNNATTLAVNDATDTVYASDFVPQTPSSPETSSILAIDGATNTITTAIPGELAPANGTMGLDQATNTLYVPNYGSASISVIDGASNTVTTDINQTDSMPWGAVFDAGNNTLYVTDGNDNLQLPQGQVYVVDPTSNTITASIPVDNSAASPGVDPTQNKLFVPVEGTDQVVVIDTSTNAVTSAIDVATGSSPRYVAVDTALHKAYVLGDDGVTVFDTVTDTIIGSPIPLGTASDGATSLAIDPTTHQVFATSDVNGVGELYQIDGSSPTDAGTLVSTTNIPGVGVISVAVNSTTDTLYVSSYQTDSSAPLGVSSNVYALQFLNTPTPPPTPAPAVPASSPTLADTGQNTDVPLMLGVGGGLVALGLALMQLRRLRQGYR